MGPHQTYEPDPNWTWRLLALPVTSLTTYCIATLCGVDKSIQEVALAVFTAFTVEYALEKFGPIHETHLKELSPTLAKFAVRLGFTCALSPPERAALFTAFIAGWSLSHFEPGIRLLDKKARNL